MISILVVEDDDAVRDNLVRLLALEGYHTIGAGDGRLGLERARQARPDIVITDIAMPVMDGFALVEALRADPALATASILLLTGLADRSSMRRGMTVGADDYLAKPFTPNELLEALRSLLRKKGWVERSIWSAVQMREEHLRRDLAGMARGPLVQDPSPAQPGDPAADETIQATVLFSDIRGFTSLAEKLGSGEVAELLTGYFERACQPVLASGGRHLKFIGDGLMAVFTDDWHAPDLPAARRALAAGLGMALAAQDFRGWLDQRFAGRGLPPFAIGVGVHAGEVTLCRLGAAFGRETTAIGDTVNVAARLEASSKELGWTVVASSAVLQRCGAGIQTGGTTSLAVRGKNGSVDVAEITGLPGPDTDPRRLLPGVTGAPD